MTNEQFTERIHALRIELMSAIIAELEKYVPSSFDFSEDVDRSELPRQTNVNKY